MTTLEELLTTKETLLLDGAMGTMLFAAGLEQGNPSEEWNVLYPDRVRQIQRAYIMAGARIVLSNSFGGTHFRLKRHNLQDRIGELNRAAAANVRAAVDSAPHPVIAAGSIGPTGEMMKPIGNLTFEDAKPAFAEQAEALADGGVELLWIETMSDLDEVRAAIEGARSVCDLPIAVTMTFDTHGHTMMGVSPTKAFETLSAFDLIAIGANCGNGPAEIEGVIETMHSLNPELVLIAKSNAGVPKMMKGEIVYDGTPEVMADYARRVRDLGARLVGACCGSTPVHIRAMAEALGLPIPG